MVEEHQDSKGFSEANDKLALQDKEEEKKEDAFDSQMH